MQGIGLRFLQEGHSNVMNHWNVVWFPRLLPYQKKEVFGKVSFCVDAERLEVQKTQESVGIDLGIKAFATRSKNQVFDVIKPLKQAKNKLAIQRQASKQVKASKNQRQTYNKMTGIHSRISGIRKKLLHKLTTPTVKSLKLIKIEDLNVKKMMANHK